MNGYIVLLLFIIGFAILFPKLFLVTIGALLWSLN